MAPKFVVEHYLPENEVVSYVESSSSSFSLFFSRSFLTLAIIVRTRMSNEFDPSKNCSPQQLQVFV